MTHNRAAESKRGRNNGDSEDKGDGRRTDGVMMIVANDRSVRPIGLRIEKGD